MSYKKRFILSSLIGCAVFAASNVQARYENDVRLNTLDETLLPGYVYPEDHVGDTSVPPELEDEVRMYFEQGYHPISTLFYAMRNGMSVDEAKDIAEQAGINRDYLDEATKALDPILPGGVCGTSYFSKDPTLKPGTFSLSELKEQLQQESDNGSAGADDEPTLADVIDKYFNDNEIISINQDDPNHGEIHHPDWVKAQSTIPDGGVPDNTQDFIDSEISAHIHATADELLALVQDSNEYWYFQDSPLGEGQINSESLSASSPIQVSLYSDTQQAIVSPWQLARINEAKQTGERLPVIIFYHGSNVRPLSQISKKIGFPELVNAYIRQGIKVAPVPSWQYGNYHTLVTVQQLNDIFDLPAKEDIPEERYSRALSTINNGKPLHVALVGGKMFLDDPDRAVAMAQDGGYDLMPVNISYVDLEPQVSDFSVCENAFPFAAGGFGGIGGDVPSGVVVFPPEDCVPETDIIRTPRTVRVSVSPDRFKTVIDERVVVVVPCP